MFPNIQKTFVAGWTNLTCPELVDHETIEIQFTLTLYPLAGNATHSLSTMIEAAVAIEHDGL
jgi:hypothetical protein